MRYLKIVCAAACLAGVMAGCSPNFSQPVLPPPQLTPAQQDFEAHWQASLDVLRKYDFVTEPSYGAVQNRRDGLIQTLPMVGRHWFEPWRKDAATRFDMWEGTLQTIYRTATVSIVPTAPDAETFTVKVVVDVDRSDRIRPAMTSTTDIHGMFATPGSMATEKRLMADLEEEDETLAGQKIPQTVELGEDKALAAKLEQAIRARAAEHLWAASGK